MSVGGVLFRPHSTSAQLKFEKIRVDGSRQYFLVELLCPRLLGLNLSELKPESKNESAVANCQLHGLGASQKVVSDKGAPHAARKLVSPPAMADGPAVSTGQDQGRRHAGKQVQGLVLPGCDQTSSLQRAGASAWKTQLMAKSCSLRYPRPSRSFSTATGSRAEPERCGSDHQKPLNKQQPGRAWRGAVLSCDCQLDFSFDSGAGPLNPRSCVELKLKPICADEELATRCSTTPNSWRRTTARARQSC